MSTSTTRGIRRSSEEYLAAAMALLDETGPAGANLGFTVAAAADMTGMARSAVYRRWDTIEQLNDDLAYFKACHRQGWQRRILEQLPQRPFLESLRASIGDFSDRDGIGVRGVVVAWPVDHPARARVATWEEAWLTAFERWLDQHARSTARRWTDGTSPRLAAIALAALIEGRCLEQIFRLGFEHVEWARAEQGFLIERADALLESLFADGPAPSPGAEEVDLWLPDASPIPPDDSIPASADRLGLSFANKSYVHWLPEPGRLVDLGQLSRRIGVTERRLYGVWPTAGEMNTELAARLLDRTFTRYADVASLAIEVGDDDECTTFEELLISMFAAMTVPAQAQGEASMFALSMTLTHPLVRAETIATFEAWRPALRSIFLAMLALTGAYRRPGVTADAYHDTVIAALVGSQRLVELHPTLAAETVRYRDVVHPLLGMVLLRVGASLATLDRPRRPVVGGAPPIASI